MIIPLRTDQPYRRRPRITQGLIAVNVVIYLCGMVGHALGRSDSFAIVEWGHFDPAHFQWWQLVTSLFLHDPNGVWHVAFNMLFLWIFGAAVEDRLGRIGFIGFYLIGGAVAGLAHAMVSNSPVIGASGAVAAVTGAFLALFPRSKIIVFFLIGFGVAALPSLWLIGLYFVINVLQQTGELLGNNTGRVAYMAHIAGYVYGFLLAFILLATKVLKRGDCDVFFLFTQSRRRAALRAVHKNAPAGLWDAPSADTGQRLQRFTDTRTLTDADHLLMNARSEISRIAAAQDLSAAAEKYKTLLHTSPDAVFDETRQLELANQLYADGHHAVAAAAYELFIERYPRASKASEVRLILGVLYTRQLNHPQRAKEVIEAAKPLLHDVRQTALADTLLAELSV